MTTPFAAAQRTSSLIGRQVELDTIHHAVFPGDRSCQVVFLQGKGGFGKTRLLEETLRRLGNPEQLERYRMTEEDTTAGLDWSRQGPVIAADLVDLIDLRLHTRNNFLARLRDSLSWAGTRNPALNFSDYESAKNTYQRNLLDNVDFHVIQRSARQAETAFLEEYRRAAAETRLVLAIDTAELLSQLTSEDLLRTKVLREGDIAFQTLTWLGQALKQGWFENTTLLFAGRELEGKGFFAQMEKDAKDAGAACHRLQAAPFTPEEIRAYFENLRQAYSQDEKNLRDLRIAEYYAHMAGDAAQIERLHFFTGGQPVRLALFADMIVEARQIPDVLRGDPAPLQRMSAADKDLAEWNLEEQVLNLLFQAPRLEPKDFVGSSDPSETQRRLDLLNLRRKILLALARAPQGLSALQLHYLIHNDKGLPPQEWEREAYSPEKVRAIEDVMKRLAQLALVKNRPPALELAFSNGQLQISGKSTPRLGLQDEVYRIFAEHAAPHIQPGKPLDEADERERRRLQSIWAGLLPDERDLYERKYIAEMDERRELNLRLREWAHYNRKRLYKALQTILETEERNLEVELYRVTPAAPRKARLRISEEESARRDQLRQALGELGMEHLNYAFLLNPSRELNDAFNDLADSHWAANDEDADVLAQALVWRLLFDHHALKFVNWDTRAASQERGEHEIDVVRRAALQEAACRWIKRLAMRKQYQEALEYAGRLEQFIQGLPDGHAKTSWQHTFAAGERASWREYTVLFTGDANEIRLALKRLEGVAEKLTALYVHTVDEVAIPATGEHGFKGHPAETRLRRQLSYLYANLGYARAQLGEAEQAVADYSRALSYVHESGVRSHRAMTLNNLARVLSDLGRDHQALRLCLDALAMRKEIGADQPIGLSHSTLALILNDHNNPDRSWVEASKALVYFQRVGDTRGIGLADMQLCEGLRRMAAQANFGRAFPATREELYSAAEEAADEALGIFILGEPNETERKEGKVKEPVRWIEVRIEKGCLHRDRVSYLRSKESAAWQGQYNKALGLLEEAARYAGEKGWRRAQLDATLNIAWTHYYAEKPDLDAKKLEHDFPKTRAALERVMLLIAEITGKPGEPVTPGQPLPKPREHPSYLYFQLSKLHGLSGRMALDIFSNWVLNFTRDQVRHPGVDPKEIRPKIHREIYEIIKSDPHGLDVAAAAYLHGVCYAQLYAPQSISLTYLQDTLFSYVAEFNQEELLAFTEFLRGHALWEPHQKLLPADTASLEAFLRDTVGIPNQTAGRGGHSL